MRRVSLRWLVVLGACLALLGLGWGPVTRHVRAAQFLQTLAAKPAAASGIQTEGVTILGAGGPIRGRLYFRAGQPPGAGIVVAHGVHYQGIDEGRLVPFARALAEAGYTVLTPELADVADYRITADGVNVIGDAVQYLAARRDHVASGRVGLLGFSFAGGLSLVAARDPATAEHLSFVTSVGGHHDLRRVMRFLVHNEIETPHGIVAQPAHEYGLVVLVYGNLERFVPEQDVPAMRAAFKAWLHEDRKTAREAAEARVSPEAELIWELLETQQLQMLAPELDQILESQRAELAALSSAGHLQNISVPVYLLHGSHDSVIPPSETDAAALELRGVEHRALVSPLLEHVEVSKTAGITDKLALVSFMAKLM
jgi:dienelactone hydrolase